MMYPNLQNRPRHLCHLQERFSKRHVVASVAVILIPGVVIACATEGMFSEQVCTILDNGCAWLCDET